MSRKPRIDPSSIDSVPLKPGNTSVPASERIVLTGLLQHGDKVLFEILAYVSVDSFVTIENQAIFKSVNDLIINDKIEKPGLASIIAYLNKHSFEFKIDLEEYLQTLEIQKVSLQEIYHHAKRVGRAKILREAKMALLHAGDAVENADIDRPIAETLNKIEEPILLLHSNLTGQNDSVEIGKIARSIIAEFAEQKQSHAGIPSGLPIYDRKIGRGFRPGVHVIAARAKMGKSMVSMFIAGQVTQQDVPVLYLDTELDEKTTVTRLCAHLSQVTIDEIETGAFAKNDVTRERVEKAVKILEEKNKLTYLNVKGKRHTEWIRTMRQWLFQKVGFEADGKAKPCLIILDYLKMMDTKEMGNLREDQLLGQVMTDLQNFSGQFAVPILSLAQLNRDGINNSTESALAGADKIAWFCSSLTILRRKESEDYAADGLNDHTHKLIVILSRFGQNDPGEYINLKFDKSRVTLKEGPLSTISFSGGGPVTVSTTNPVDKKKGKTPDPAEAGKSFFERPQDTDILDDDLNGIPEFNNEDESRSSGL